MTHIQDYEIPKTNKGIQRFLCYTNIRRYLITSYSNIIEGVNKIMVKAKNRIEVREKNVLIFEKAKKDSEENSCKIEF
jgi:hypothetical protein